MNPEALNEQLTRDPYIPLRLTLTTGEVVDIPDPGAVFIENLALHVFGVRRQGSRIADRLRLISLRHIVAVDRVEPSAGRP